MEMRFIVTLSIASLLLGVFLGHNMSSVDFLPGTPQADSSFLSTAIQALQSYEAEHNRFFSPSKINIDQNKGIIETEWSHFGKEDLTLEIDIIVWDSSFRVEVRQRPMFFGAEVKTDGAQRIERNLQVAIETYIDKNKTPSTK